MKLNNLFSGENRKIITTLASAEFARRVVKVRQLFSTRFKQIVRQILSKYI